MIRFVRFPKYHSITHTHTHSERDEIHDKFKRVHATRDETRQITKETIRFRTWCSSAKRENINGPAFSFFLQECQLYHSYHLYHSFISQENDSNSNAQRHTQVLRKLNSRFALEHRYHFKFWSFLVSLQKLDKRLERLRRRKRQHRSRRQHGKKIHVHRTLFARL